MDYLVNEVLPKIESKGFDKKEERIIYEKYVILAINIVKTYLETYHRCGSIHEHESLLEFHESLLKLFSFIPEHAYPEELYFSIFTLAKSYIDNLLDHFCRKHRGAFSTGVPDAANAFLNYIVRTFKYKEKASVSYLIAEFDAFLEGTPGKVSVFFNWKKDFENDLMIPRKELKVLEDIIGNSNSRGMASTEATQPWDAEHAPSAPLLETETTCQRLRAEHAPSAPLLETETTQHLDAAHSASAPANVDPPTYDECVQNRFDLLYPPLPPTIAETLQQQGVFSYNASDPSDKPGCSIEHEHTKGW